MGRTATPTICSPSLRPPGAGTANRWCYSDLVAGRVRLWWRPDQPLAVAAGTLASAEIEATIYPKLVALWGKEPRPDNRTDNGGAPRPDSGGSAALDIGFFASPQPPPPGTVTAAGEWKPYETCHSPQAGSVLLDAMALSTPQGTQRVINPVQARNTLTHELTHAIQAAFPIRGGAGCEGSTGAHDNRWMTESIATWAPFTVYPQEPQHDTAFPLLDIPQQRLDFIPTPDPTKPAAVLRPYSGYLFFLFLQDTFSLNAPVAAWTQLDTHPPIDAIDQALAPWGGLGPNWVRFTQWLWNGAPYERLKAYGLKRGAITVGTTPTGNNNPVTNTTVNIALPTTARSASRALPVNLEPLSQQYRKLVITGTNIRTLTFQTPPLTAPFAATSAILTAPGQPPSTTTWTSPASTAPRYFCLDTQPVTGAVLMFSAGGPNEGGSGNARVLSSNSCAAPSGLEWLTPAGVTGGGTVTGRATIDRPAPANGVELLVSSSIPAAATVPAKIVVPQGATQASFTVTTRPVDAETGLDITISRAKELAIPGTTHNLVGVRPATPQQIVVPARAQGGTTFSASVVLNAPAGPSGVTVALEGVRLTPPPSVVIPAGQTTVQFPVTANPTGCQTACELSGQLIGHANGSIPVGNMTVVGPP